jgi:Indole-3-glycerol phosphate synthase
MARNIRDDIVEKRRVRLARHGAEEGADVPKERLVPLVPFCRDDGLVCEVKRRSPSKGAIASGLDAVEQAGLYVRAGVGNISVLTVPEGFGGSLDDLMAVKRAYPEVAVIRKDFLVNTADIDVAWRAGADAVLLISGMLAADEMAAMYRHAKKLGMEALVEIHDEDDLAKARTFSPTLVGINSRDLTSFRIDPLLPVKVKAGIDWKARVIYESGVSSSDQAAFVASSGFSGLLIGEAVVRRPALAGEILRAMRSASPSRFWSAVGERLAHGGAMVKICGLTREDDARKAVEAGADMLGFVFWPGSKRRAEPALLERLRDIAIPKIAVTVNRAGADGLAPEVGKLLADGLIDAVQFHGDETPDDCARLAAAGYKAIRPGTVDDAQRAKEYRTPRILLDAAGALPGGNGVRVDASILEAYDGPLWLAGGVTPGNAREIVRRWRPELVDTASGVEDAPGIKNSAAMHRLIEEIRNA